MNKELRNKIIVSAAALLVAAVMAVVYFGFVLEKPEPGEKTVTLEVAYLDKNAPAGETRILEYKYENLVTTAQYVIDLLIEFNEPLELGLKYDDSNPAFGAYITSLKETDAVYPNGYTYTVNGTMDGVLGISSQTVKDKDVIRFEYRCEIWEYDEELDDWVITSSEMAEGGDDSAKTTPKSLIRDNTVMYIMIMLISVLVLFSVGYTVVYAIRERGGKA